MGRAIVRDPKLFLFDEPLSNLDAKLRVQMRAEIRRLQRRLQVTSLYVTHDQVEAMTLGDRLLVMHLGVPVQLATPMEVFEQPANTYVASFIGTPAMNLLPGTLTHDGAVAVVYGREIVLPRPITRPVSAEVTLGIRPEHIDIDPDGFSLPVDLVEPLGSEMLVHGRLADGSLLTVKLPSHTPVGETISVSFRVEQLHLFDRASGNRIS
jgi:sn-glycerol 3-phosphate transport system ATP-binding protein